MDKKQIFINSLNKDIKIKFKKESLLMKFLCKVLFFNKKFSNSFVTTIGKTIYFPNEQKYQDETYCIPLVSHEYVHISDSKKYFPFFEFLYLFPQVLFLFSFFSFYSLWFLLFLIFLLPLPAYFRMRFELKAYAMTLFVYFLIMKRNKAGDSYIIEQLTEYARKKNDNQFKGSDYYWMWPFGCSEKFDKIIKDIMSGDILEYDPVFAKVQDSFQKIYP